ncbi:MAG: glycosyltransferase [Anaerolineae bacterium]|nr:glycosyltransferase [Anaerolineae bacterium]
MRIALITTYPPSRGTLNEYAYHLVQQIATKPEVTELIILGDKVAEPEGQLPPNVRIERIWQYGDKFNNIRIVRALRRIRPDIAWFNLQFTLFGADPLSATAGLLTPLLTRLSGICSVVLMHNLMETTDLGSAVGVKSPVKEAIYRLGGALVTRALLSANLVTTTLPRYVEILRKKYHVDDVILTPHGAFTESTLPHFAEVPSRVLMTFGKFGTYKRVETLIEAYATLRESGTTCKLVIAGSDSPNSPGYLEEVRQRYLHVPDITFTGYVAEDEVPRLFNDSQIVVLPYNSTTGSSGVLHQAGSYGKPVVMPRIGDLAELTDSEGFGAVYFTPDDVQSMAASIKALLDDPDQCRELGTKNFVATRGLTINEVIDWYLLHFERLLDKTNSATRAHAAEVEPAAFEQP